MKKSSQQEQRRQRRRHQRKITSDQRRVLLAEYVESPDDQPLTERHAAARLGYSRAWMQMRRVTGGGPRFFRTASRKIVYVKADVEAYRTATLTPHTSTSQYLDGARP